MNEKTTWPIAKLHNWEQNPRSINKDDFARLKKQIQKLGVYKPLLITEDGTVLGGNMRFRAYQELGITDVWVSVVDAPDDTKKLEYALSDNDRAGTYNEQALAELVTNAPDIDLGDYKVDLGEPVDLQALLDKFGPTPEIEEEEAPEPPIEATSKLGEVYQLGRHRLMCGDSASQSDIDTLLDVSPDMVYTDPPYGTLSFMNARASVAAKVGEYMEYANNETFDFEPTWNIIKDWDCPKVIWGGNYFTHLLPITTGWIVWDKRAGEHSFFSDCELAWTSLGITAKVYSIVWQGMIREGESGKRVHPTQKPIDLAVRILKDHDAGNNILDLFGGSGSTLIACEQTNRTCYMMELDPRYVDVIITRWENLTGEKAVKLEEHVEAVAA